MSHIWYNPAAAVAELLAAGVDQVLVGTGATASRSVGSPEVDEWPAVAILVDNFNRADEDPMNTNYAKLGSLGDVFRVVTNRAAPRNNDWTSVYHKTIADDFDVEIYDTIAALEKDGLGGDEVSYGLTWRIGGILTGNWDGYALDWYAGSVNDLGFYRVDNDSWTYVMSVGSATPTAGDKFGVRHSADHVVHCWIDEGSGWIHQYDGFDDTYTAAGYFGFYRYRQGGTATICRFDDFYAGPITLPVPTAGPRYTPHAGI